MKVRLQFYDGWWYNTDHGKGWLDRNNGGIYYEWVVKAIERIVDRL